MGQKITITCSVCVNRVSKPVFKLGFSQVQSLCYLQWQLINSNGNVYYYWFLSIFYHIQSQLLFCCYEETPLPKQLLITVLWRVDRQDTEAVDKSWSAGSKQRNTGLWTFETSKPLPTSVTQFSSHPYLLILLIFEQYYSLATIIQIYEPVGAIFIQASSYFNDCRTHSDRDLEQPTYFLLLDNKLIQTLQCCKQYIENFS